MNDKKLIELNRTGKRPPNPHAPRVIPAAFPQGSARAIAYAAALEILG